AAGDHFVSYPQPLTADIHGRGGGVEFAGLDAGLLGEVVEAGNGVGGVGHQRHCLAPAAGFVPGVDDPGFHVFEGSVVKATVPLVLGENGGIAGAETQTGGAFPFVSEAVDLVEFCRPVKVDEMGEHATSSDRSELAGVADEDDAPVVPVGETSEGCEFGGRSGGGFVDYQRG